MFSVPASGSISGEVAVCYSCHDGSGAVTNVKTGAVNSFALTSGHRVENTTEGAGFAVDLTNRCSSCHAPHADYRTSRRLPKASIVTSSGTAVVSGANNTWCLACHNDAQDWYKSTTSTVYPAASSPKVDASGYPVTGTFPGKSVYNDTAKNRHAAIPPGVITDPMVPSQTATRVAGDCLWCHAAHRGKSKYDSLTTTFGAPATSTVTLDRTRGDYAAACFTCHGGGSWEASGAVDIKRYAVKSPDDALATSGHRIKTTGAALPLNSPLPCYDCHNPHGSTRQNQMLLSDTLGAQLQATATAGVATTAAGRVREFCFTCHSTSDATAKVWDSVNVVYVSATASMTFQGLRRDGTLLAGQTRPSGYSLNQNYLRLKALGGSDHHAQSSTKNCYDCHGKSYAGASSPNVHAPTMGVSNGGVACYGCHAEYQPMEDNVGAVTGGVARLGSYHHVMGSATNDGDYTPASSTAYPTSVTDVYCLSCHVDHDKFNATKGANLRNGMTASPTAASSDYNATTGGVCLGCHSAPRTKDVANQKTGGSLQTPAIGSTAYDNSPHQYGVASTFSGPSSFSADCVKCHNDEQVKSYQTSTNKFGAHFSAESRLLKALGVLLAGTSTSSEENLCYKCHTGTGAGTDGYATAPMTGVARSVQNVFTTATNYYKHPVGTVSGKHTADENLDTLPVGDRHSECEDCHDSHAVQAGRHTSGQSVAGPALRGVDGVRPVWPAAEWATASSYSAVTMTGLSTDYEAYVCFKCHTAYANQPASVTRNSKTYTPTDLALEFNPANEGGHNVMAATWPKTSAVGAANNRTWTLPSAAAWLDSGWTATSMVTCSDCHTSGSASAAAGPHGSAVEYLIDPAYTTTWETARGDDPDTAGDQSNYLTTICNKCHADNYVGMNGVHGYTKHFRSEYSSQGKCIGCHVKIPHGWKRPRLIGYTTDPVPYRSISLVGMSDENHAPTRGSAPGWGKNGCATTGCDTHSTSMTTKWP